MDDLIFSGAGSGCHEDDEDQCTPLFESGSGDDLITPVYVPPTRPPSTTSKSTHSNIINAGQEKICDDEDCTDGSGDREPSTNEPTMSSSGTVVTHPGSSTTAENASINIKLTDITSEGTSESILTDGSDPTTPEGGSSSSSGATGGEGPTHPSTGISTDGTSTTLFIPEPSPEPPVHKNPSSYYPTVKTTNNKKTERVSSELSEIIALIIGIIAGALIAVILIILVILKFKSRSDPSYKVDDGKGYQQGPNAALLGNTSNGNGQTQYQMNGNVRNGDKNVAVAGGVVKKKRDSKDIKEWYV